MSDGRVRLFVAVALPAPIRNELVRWRGRLEAGSNARLRPVSPEALHATLCFLGWQPESGAEAIGAACGVVATEPPAPLALGDAVWLPPRRPRVLAVELSDTDGALGRIQAALSAALAAGGWYQPEKRPYLPHVTVARVAGRGGPGGRGGPAGPGGSSRRGGPAQPSGASAQKLTPPARLEFYGSDVVLYRSRLLRTGARYEALVRVSLGQPRLRTDRRRSAGIRADPAEGSQ